MNTVKKGVNMVVDGAARIHEGIAESERLQGALATVAVVAGVELVSRSASPNRAVDCMRCVAPPRSVARVSSARPGPPHPAPAGTRVVRVVSVQGPVATVEGPCSCPCGV